PYPELLANALFWLLLWLWFNGSSARTCQLRHVGGWFGGTSLESFPVTYLVAAPGVFMILLYAGLCLKAFLKSRQA
ncbi:MAG: hypothetical protein JSS86_23975, partial [Cyanobacteria bacterium SZAS LIN-2]|nr:hypothetical protein [Cyanobacteria bacterium SZAS LIN-2]